MKEDVILKVENLSKQYRLGMIGTGTISHDLNRWWARIRGKEDPYLKVGESNDRATKGESNYVWALKDINFEVKRGEVLGIIGKNGAGKSTLLKILSQVTGPTTGIIKSKGRIASLLEVGTGFHPEMTGKENIFLNGAILGMTKKEIASKLDEIINFSGCQRYIDTPVKRYSSGMKVRLAFAVAAHLEPDILVVDEVLAVGDIEFQKKAIGKMEDISKGEGRTVLFVSHNMAAVKSFCTRGILLDKGGIVKTGNIEDVIQTYQELSNINTIDFQKESIGNKNIKVLVVSLLSEKQYVSTSDDITFNIRFKNNLPNINLAVSLVVKNYDDVVISELPFIISENNNAQKGIYELKTTIPESILNAGCYYVNIIFGKDQKEVLFSQENILTFEIINEGIGSNYKKLPGILALKPNFELSFTDNE